MPQEPKYELTSSLPSVDYPDPDDAVAVGTRGFTPQTLRLLLACSRQITTGLAHALSKLWRRGDPIQVGFAERMLVLDLFSRFPLAFGIFRKEPSANQVVGVLDRALRRHGRPRHFVSDKGSQFTATVFRETLEALSIGQRFGAIGQYGSIAVIERFWRTLKELLGIRLWPPLSAAHLEARTELALMYYSCLRPHQGLGGATPAEVYLDKTPAMENAVRPPRKTARLTTGDEPMPFEVVFLDLERRLPVLVPTSKAA